MNPPRASEVAPSERTVADVRSLWLLPVLCAASILVAAAVLYLTQYRNFYYDEWDFIVSRRDWNPLVFLLPHWIHWSTIPILVWKLLFVTVGIRSHVPYEAALLAAHLLTVFMLFALVRLRSGQLAAFAAAMTLLVLGSGADDIVWAFQIAWAASVAFGLLALIIAAGKPSFRRGVALAFALLGSLMCSTVGVVFVAVAAVELVFDRQRRTLLIYLVPPTAAFLAWLLIFDTGRFPGSAGISGGVLQGPRGFDLVTTIATFVLIGLKSTAAGLFGLPGLGVVVLPLLALWIAWHWYRQRNVPSWQLGLVCGCVFWFALISSGRSQFGVDQASQSRYIYVAVALLLPVVANAAARLPWRGLWRPALAIVFAGLAVSNLTQLLDASISLRNFMRYEDAELATVEAFRSAPDLATNQHIDDGLMPQLITGDYLTATRELGSPVPQSNIATLQRLPPDSRFAVDRVMVNLFAHALSVRSHDAGSAVDLPCQYVDSSPVATLEFQIPDGQTVMLDATQAGTAFLYLGFLNPPGGVPVKRVAIPASTPEWIHLPDTGKHAVWRLRVEAIDLGALRVCSFSSPHVSSAGYFYGEAERFTLGPGWSTVPDPGANAGRSVKAAMGTPGPEGVFGDAFAPAPGSYDLWYRVRVSNNPPAKPEMLLGLVDVDTGSYAAAEIIPPSEATTRYGWLQVDSNLTFVPGHRLRFQANIASRLSTDWFIDEAALVPAGTSMTQSA